MQFAPEQNTYHTKTLAARCNHFFLGPELFLRPGAAREDEDAAAEDDAAPPGATVPEDEDAARRRYGGEPLPGSRK